MVYMKHQISELSINGLKRTLKKMPNFDHYNKKHMWTKALKNMWVDTSKCGGPITEKLNSESALNIPTPDIA